MRHWATFWLILPVAALINATFVGMDWLWPVLVFFVLSYEDNRNYLAAFVAGVVADLFSGKFLGLSSLYYLGGVFLLSLVKRSYRPGPVMFLLFLVAGELFYGFFFRYL